MSMEGTEGWWVPGRSSQSFWKAELPAEDEPGAPHSFIELCAPNVLSEWPLATNRSTILRLP